MKKVLSLFFVAILAICLCACGSRKVTYDGKDILRIETVRGEGFAPFPCDYVRTFDFEHGKVTDTRLADEKYLNKAERKLYNTPKTITVFSKEQGQALIDRIGELGFFDWEERYKTDDVVFDAAPGFISVYFADGTEKTTMIFFMYPPNYMEICNAVEESLSVAIYYV